MFGEQVVVSDNAGTPFWFGSAVCIAGDLAFVGARNETVDGSAGRGAVYVYRRTVAGWQQVQRILSSDGQERDQFGYAIAVWGSTLVVTAPDASRHGVTWKGQAYVFSEKGGLWVEESILSLQGNHGFTNLGNSLALGPSRIVLGGGGASRGGTYEPRKVYIFDYAAARRGNRWRHRQTLDSPIPDDVTSSFGASLAVSGDTLLVGARASTFNSQPGRGAVYVYEYKSGAWMLGDRLVANDGQARDNFGLSIGLQGDVAVVGAPGVTLAAGPSQGAAYVFRKRRGRWEQVSKIKGSDVVPFSLFGASISLYEKSLNEKLLLVGAYGADSYKGAAYLFRLDRETWREVEKLTCSEGMAGDVFGYYTALSRNAALVGSWSAMVDGYPQAGNATFFAL